MLPPSPLLHLEQPRKVWVPCRHSQSTTPPAAPEQLLTAGTLHKAMSVQTKNAEIPPAEQNDAGVEEQELVCPTKNL